MKGKINHDLPEPFLRWLAALRAAAGYSQSSFAEACQMNQAQISRYERQGIKPHYLTMKRMADVLKCDVTALYSAQADPRKEVG